MRASYYALTCFAGTRPCQALVARCQSADQGSDNGSISLIRIKKGDSQYREYEGKAYMFDVQNIGEETLYFQVTEFKSEIEKEIHIIE